MTSGEFHSHIVKIAKRCKFPNPEAEERAIRDAIFLGMNSQQARDKAINLMNEEGKELSVEFLMNQLAVEDCYAHHKSLSQLDSTSSMNLLHMTVDKTKARAINRNELVERTRDRIILEHMDLQITVTNLENPLWMEGKCMRCGKPEHQLGQKCPAKNAKCKDCHKIGHFHKVCQSRKRTKRANLVQTPPQDDDVTHINKIGVRPRVNMLKTINHIEATRGPQGKHLKLPITTHPKQPYKHHLVVRVDTGADVNIMNEKTFKELFPEVELSVCPHEIQNFGNSIADILILGQFYIYLEFRGDKYLNTFIVTNVNDCPNLLSYGATFRMGVLLPNYREENIVKGENVPNFTSTGTSEGISSNVFQILQDL